MVLIGGEPGIGKSTLLLQVAARLAERRTSRRSTPRARRSPLQVKLRADRLARRRRRRRAAQRDEPRDDPRDRGRAAPAVLIVDSIQTVFTADLEGAPGNVGQVRECAARLMRFAKESGTTVFVVGHVTKGGGIAGPKTLEHIVDTVLYFEGESIARSPRAARDEESLRQRRRDRRLPHDGGRARARSRIRPSCSSATARCTRREAPSRRCSKARGRVLVEVQALAAKAGFGTPQRVATGYDGRRLALLLAVLDKRAGLSFAQLDVFLNVVGGVRLQEPAGDLAVAAALASSVYDRALPHDAVFVGEVGLGGEIRPVSQAERRARRSGEHGNDDARISPSAACRSACRAELELVGVRTIADLFERVFAVSSATASTRPSRATSAWSSSPAAAARAPAATRAEAVPLGRRASRCCCTACRRSWRAPTSVSVVCVLPQQLRRRSAAVALPVRRRSAAGLGRRAHAQRERWRNGLEDLPDEAAIVLVHDAARPLVGDDDDRARRSTRCATGTRAIAALPVVDTLKEVDERRHASCARSSASDCGARRRRRAFRAQVIVRRASRRASASASRATDDAALCERLGIPGARRARKRARAQDHRRERTSRAPRRCSRMLE